MVNSLLLGSAATLIAVAGAQAADLPVKAKAVEYVKVCSLYGAGFYYIPGTDTCIKIGGYVRVDYDIGGNGTGNPYLTGANARDTRADTDESHFRNRALITLDVRTQTEYGTLRSYTRAGWTADNLGPAAGNGWNNNVYYDRAFIQFAGFTFGKIQSFFDFAGPHLNTTLGYFSDTGGVGTHVLAYTAQLGNGLSFTFGIEDGVYRRSALIDTTVAFGTVGGNAVSDTAGASIPDFVANLRVDQAWGSAQISGALHEVKAAYYNTPNVAIPIGAAFNGTSPGSEWGWAVLGGVNFNLPWGPGDQLILQAAYAQGATTYTGNNIGSVGMFSNGPVGFGDLAMSWASDGVFSTPGNAIAAAYGGGTASGDIELTRSWAAFASLQHYWTPALRSSIVVGGFGVNYNGAATALVCTNLNATGQFPIAVNGAGCDPDFSVLQVGSRTVWSPVKNLDLSVDVLYSRVNQSFTGIWTSGGGARPVGPYRAQDQDHWNFLFRAQRNFWL
jgi:hypothetical protein